MGKLHGIGVEPGNPELPTLKARRILNAADMIFCPEKEAGVSSFAFDIIQGLLEDTKVGIVNSVYPMHYHGTQSREMWKQDADYIAQYLNGDRTDAFITPRDPTVYSMFAYTLLYIEEASMEVGVVPGVAPFCAMVDSMKIPLVTWNEDLVVAPVCKNSSENLGRVFGEHDSVVLMKPSIDSQALLKALKENHLEDKSVLITKTGTEEECLVTDFEELERHDIPCSFTVIIKEWGRQ